VGVDLKRAHGLLVTLLRDVGQFVHYEVGTGSGAGIETSRAEDDMAPGRVCLGIHGRRRRGGCGVRVDTDASEVDA